MSERPDLLRKQIYLTRDLNRRLCQTAKQAGESESSLVREALEEYLAQEERRLTPEENNPILGMAGMFAGGPECGLVSENVDEELARVFYKPSRKKR